jgi:hypothetical protein
VGTLQLLLHGPDYLAPLSCSDLSAGIAQVAQFSGLTAVSASLVHNLPGAEFRQSLTESGTWLVGTFGTSVT